jgi:hypothetical protein
MLRPPFNYYRTLNHFFYAPDGITVRNETIAEVRSANMMVPAGEAVRKLANLRKKLFRPVRERDQEPVSKRVKDYLYPEGKP